MKKIVLIGTVLFFSIRIAALNDKGAVSVVPENGASYMVHLAAESGDLATVVGNVFGGAIGRCDGLGRTPAAIALANGRFKVFYYLLDVEAFLKACETGDLLKIQNILAVAKENTPMPTELGLLHAAEKNQLDIVKYLIEIVKVDINSRDPESWATALMLAAERGYDELTEYLLKHGASPNKQDANGSSVLFRVLSDDAYPDNALAIVKLLVHYGADVRATSAEYENESIISFAVSGSRGAEAGVLLDAGAPVDEVVDSQTLLHSVARWQDGLETIRVLVAHGIDIFAKNKDGHTALDIACDQLGASDDVVRYLRLLYAFYDVVGSKLTFENFAKQHLVDSDSRLWVHELLHRGDQKTADLFYDWAAQDDLCKKEQLDFADKATMYFTLFNDACCLQQKAELWFGLAKQNKPKDGNEKSIKLRRMLKRALQDPKNDQLKKKYKPGLTHQFKKTALATIPGFAKMPPDLKIFFK